MKIEIEAEFVTFKMTATEARSFHHAVCRAINDIRANRNDGRDGAGEGDEANVLHKLKSFDSRLQDIFYKHQQN